MGWPSAIFADPGQQTEARVRLGRIGLDRVAGFLDGGMATLAPRPDLVERTERITAATLAERLASGVRLAILDVREALEWQEKHIQGSLNIPLGYPRRRLDQVPRDQRISVHCAGGYRSSVAASILKQSGHTDVVDLVGGMGAWEASVDPTR